MTTAIRRRGLGLVKVSVLLVGLTGCTRSASNVEPVEQPSSPTPAYEETRHLAGQELADALGLEPLEHLPTSWIHDTDPVLGACAREPGAPPRPGAATVDTGVAVYCLAEVAHSKAEAEDLARRLMGYLPCGDPQHPRCTEQVVSPAGT